MPPEQEGVIKYQLTFDPCPLDIDPESLAALNEHRKLMIDRAVLGQDDRRYEGCGFGNISLRCPSNVSPETASSFWISGSQTGHLDTLDSNSISQVVDLNPAHNTLHALGKTKPSSESMTHGVLFQLNPEFKSVIHVHSPDIWSQKHALGLASTDQNIAYGTPAMANAVKELAEQLLLSSNAIIFCMDGHEDGVVAAASNLPECAALILDTLNEAQKLR